MTLRKAGYAKRRWGVWLLVVWLAGCVAAPVAPLASATGAAPSLMALQHFMPTFTPQPTRTRLPATAFPTWTPTVTFTQTLSPTPMPTATLTPTPVFVICSPVATLALDQVWRFVSVPYLPPPPGSDGRHEGIDIVYYRLNDVAHPIEGDIVQSVLRGKIIAAISSSFPYGNFVIVETRRAALPGDLANRLKVSEGQSLYLLYAHMQDGLSVSLGDEVPACGSLGRVGKTGNTDAPHLHLETRLGPSGAVFEVMAAFVENVTLEEEANYRLWRTSGKFNYFDPMLLLDPQHPSPTVTPRPTQRFP